MVIKKSDKDKSKPLFSFNVPILMKISVSGYEDDSFLKELDQYCKHHHMTRTDLMNKILLNELRSNEIYSFEELFRQTGVYDMVQSPFKISLKQFLGINKLSPFLLKKINEVIKQ